MTVAFRWSLLVTGEVVLVLFLLTFGNSFVGFTPVHRIQLAILASLGALGWGAILWRPSRLPVLLVLAPLPLLAALAITSVTSRYPSLSWYATWQCAAYIGIAWLLAMQAAHPVGRRNLVAAMGVVVAFVIATYLIQVMSAWQEWLSLGLPVSSLPLRPLGDGGLLQIPTWVPDVVAIGAPCVVASLWIRQRRFAAAALAATALAAIVLSGTRSVLLLIAVCSVAAVVMSLAGRKGRRTAALATIAAIMVVTSGLGVILLAGRAFDEGRSSAYSSAIARFGESPLVGTGPGTYGVERMSDPVDALSHLAFPDAHNIVLTTIAESGVVGVLGLFLAIVSYVMAIRRSWRRAPEDRRVVTSVLVGLAVVAGHAMVEVVFALIGVVLLVIAGVSIAAAGAGPSTQVPQRRHRGVGAALLAGLMVIVLGSVVTVRNETTLDSIAAVDSSLVASPGAALQSARDATDRSPDIAIAWWARALAADAAGQSGDAIDAARRLASIEGFGQEWVVTAVLSYRAGDERGAREALDRAMQHPPNDPMVDLNAAILYDAAGDAASAKSAARRLLDEQPDIEPILVTSLPSIAATIASVRDAAALDRVASGDIDSALLIALSGEDRALASSVLDQLSTTDPATVAYLRAIVSAWFGDTPARSAADAVAIARPSPAMLGWSWRLAIHACDARATEQWGRAAEIASGSRPAAPTAIGVAPGFQVRMLPIRYPGVVWRMDLPVRPYVDGIWTYVLGSPSCAPSTGG